MKRLMVAAFLSLALADAALASVPVTTRSDWVSADGTDLFHANQGGNGTWTETLNGVPTFHFTFVTRTDTYVLLYDASRQMHVWLYGSSAYLAQNGATPQQFRSGHWDDRRLYTYRLSDGLYYFNLYPGRQWRWARASGFVSNVTETLRNNDQIQVYDPGTRHTFSFLDHEVWAKPDGGSWYKLADGGWN